MLNEIKRFKNEIILVFFTSLITAVVLNGIKKPELRIPYPNTQSLPTYFQQLTCEQVSETYMRAWSEGSDLVHDSTARVQLSLHEEKLREWESGYRDPSGNIVDTSKVKKATITLNLNNNEATFAGDNLWNLDGQPFEINVNNKYRLAGMLSISEEEQPRYDIAGTFMLDKTTSLLILSDTNTMVTQNESFGTRSRLFTCSKM